MTLTIGPHRGLGDGCFRGTAAWSAPEVGPPIPQYQPPGSIVGASSCRYQPPHQLPTRLSCCSRTEESIRGSHI